MTVADVIKTLESHRDQHYPNWCKERGMLNFVIVLLRGVT